MRPIDLPRRSPFRSRSRVAAAAALTAWTLTAVGCGGGSKPGSQTDSSVDAPGGQLSSGYYGSSNLRSRSDACGLLAPSTDLAMAQGSVVVAPSSVTISPGFGGVAGFAPGDLVGFVTGTDITAGATATLDFSTGALMNPPYDCVMRINSNLSGATTATDTARVTLDLTLSVQSGTQCGLAASYLGSLTGSSPSPPCHTTLTFDLTKTGDFPPPLVYRLDSVVASGAVLTQYTNTSPTAGSASVAGVFENVDIAGSYHSVCAGPSGASSDYTVQAVSADYAVLVVVNPSAWVPGPATIDGTLVRVDVLRLSDGVAATATSGTITLDSAPTTQDDPQSQCGVTFGPLDLTLR